MNAKIVETKKGFDIHTPTDGLGGYQGVARFATRKEAESYIEANDLHLIEEPEEKPRKGK